MKKFSYAVPALLATLASANAQQLEPATPIEAAAPEVVGVVDKTEAYNGKAWLYAKVRHPTTGALFVVRVVLLKDGVNTYPQSRLLERPKVLGSR